MQVSRNMSSSTARHDLTQHKTKTGKLQGKDARMGSPNARWRWQKVLTRLPGHDRSCKREEPLSSKIFDREESRCHRKRRASARPPELYITESPPRGRIRRPRYPECMRSRPRLRPEAPRILAFPISPLWGRPEPTLLPRS